MISLNILSEFIPILLAFTAIVIIAISKKPAQDRWMAVLVLLACVLLLIAQTGWLQALLLGNMVGMGLFEHIWTIFNIIVMLTYIKMYK